MNNKNTLFVIIFLLLVGICGYAIGKYFSTPAKNKAAELSCPNTLTDIIQSAKGDVYKIDNPNYVQPQSDILLTYSVHGDLITNPVFNLIPSTLKDEQQDSATQKQVWKIFTTLISAKDRQMVTEYMIFTDGNEETLAAVEQVPADLTHWIVEIDVADLANKDELLFTLVHEYAHLLTLNNSQVAIDQELYDDPNNLSLLKRKAVACPNYFEGGGCSLPHSYINTFYQRFWIGVDAEWEKINILQYADDLKPYYAGLYNFYLAHRDQFVDDYATTHPAEDIAESFAYFVFSPKPETTSVRGQKILFFYDYPELVKLRQTILQGTCSIAQ